MGSVTLYIARKGIGSKGEPLVDPVIERTYLIDTLRKSDHSLIEAKNNFAPRDWLVLTVLL